MNLRALLVYSKCLNLGFYLCKKESYSGGVDLVLILFFYLFVCIKLLFVSIFDLLDSIHELLSYTKLFDLKQGLKSGFGKTPELLVSNKIFLHLRNDVIKLLLFEKLLNIIGRNSHSLGFLSFGFFIGL
jgi:hypothetical protein